MLALLGSNGAGKTTVARVCSGLMAPTAGRVFFDGDDVTGERTYKYARRGIVHAPEGRSVFASLTVAENLELTFRRSRGRAGVRDALDEAFTMFPRLGERRQQVAGTLSGGEQRMLSLSRVMVEQPRLLIADELSLGLAPIIVDEVYGTLEQIRDAGTTLLIVEQHVHHALGHRRRRDRAREGRGRVLGPGRRSSATCRRACSAPTTRRPTAGRGVSAAEQ